MQGHFDVYKAAYPIGYLRTGDSYKVTDMRSMEALHSQPIPKEQAVSVAAVANQHMRDLPQDKRPVGTELNELVSTLIATH